MQRRYLWNARLKEESPDPRYSIWCFPFRDQSYTVTRPLGYRGDRHGHFVTEGFRHTYGEACSLVTMLAHTLQERAERLPVQQATSTGGIDG